MLERKAERSLEDPYLAAPRSLAASGRGLIAQQSGKDSPPASRGATADDNYAASSVLGESKWAAIACSSKPPHPSPPPDGAREHHYRCL